MNKTALLSKSTFASLLVYCVTALLAIILEKTPYGIKIYIWVGFIATLLILIAIILFINWLEKRTKRVDNLIKKVKKLENFERQFKEHINIHERLIKIETIIDYSKRK